MYLSKSELTSLTGYKQPSAIMRWLKAEGFVFVRGVDGWPRVSRAHHDMRMNGDVRTARRVEPNRGALKEMQHGKAA